MRMFFLFLFWGVTPFSRRTAACSLVVASLRSSALRFAARCPLGPAQKNKFFAGSGLRPLLHIGYSLQSSNCALKGLLWPVLPSVGL
ncbi:hypothetical protein SapgrDRAFT_0002 [Saprospira grandis DSM 2844]|uniref:Secreted protein n=1 Tax=Saprospira grandis DSM 2844 TaxID=694433 RepID=J0NWA7_9BACT|nr:hypothetical protein SapgrDRAFT_0002 [Saprospira grandis DSM 2844]